MNDVDWVVVPSLWWEVGPNTVREAQWYGRPIICSGIGAMAERVRAGETGLHFRVGDPGSLAATIRRAIETPQLWASLRSGITRPRTAAEHAAALVGMYDCLRAQRERAAA